MFPCRIYILAQLLAAVFACSIFAVVGGKLSSLWATTLPAVALQQQQQQLAESSNTGWWELQQAVHAH